MTLNPFSVALVLQENRAAQSAGHLVSLVLSRCQRVWGHVLCALLLRDESVHYHADFAALGFDLGHFEQLGVHAAG